MSAKTTKKTFSPTKSDTDIRAEYRFDYTKAKSNRFASRTKGSVVAVLLEPDVAAVFKTSKSVNAVLRSAISVLPRTPKRRAIGSRGAV